MTLFPQVVTPIDLAAGIGGAALLSLNHALHDGDEEGYSSESSTSSTHSEWRSAESTSPEKAIEIERSQSLGNLAATCTEHRAVRIPGPMRYAGVALLPCSLANSISMAVVAARDFSNDRTPRGDGRKPVQRQRSRSLGTDSTLCDMDSTSPRTPTPTLDVKERVAFKRWHL